MVKTTDNKSAKASSRPTRASAPKTFADEESESDEIQDADDNEGNDSEGFDVSKLMDALQKQRSKKSAAHFATFDETQKILFANARKHAKGLSREGSLYIEQLKSNILSLRETEDSYQETVNTLIPLWTEQDASVEAYTSSHHSSAELFSQRTELVQEATRMVQEGANTRHEHLKNFLADARALVEESREQQANATDASRLLKHYRSLLS